MLNDSEKNPLVAQKEAFCSTGFHIQGLGFELSSQMWEASVLPLCNGGPSNISVICKRHLHTS